MINGWRIDIDAVSTVLTNVDLAATDLATSIDGIDVAQGLLGGACTAVLGSVSAAVDEVVLFEQARLTSIGNRIVAGSLGLATATQGYNFGDEQMAVDAQTAVGSVDLSHFGIEGGN
jgi:hypothetical protein